MLETLRPTTKISEQILPIYCEVERCRICGNKDLRLILSLGQQALTGVFPKTSNEEVPVGPVDLIKCYSDSGDSCGLVQLRQSYRANLLYGENYGYRSGLNPSMVVHLRQKVAKILSISPWNTGDLAIDIGSNDSTLLQAYPETLMRVGIDPGGLSFKKYYPQSIHLIPDFFSAEAVRKTIGLKKAKFITSIAMFYDLEDPLAFMRQIREILADDGIWLFEQSYLPSMLSANSYDTICHEHLEYYSLTQIDWMAKRTGFKIIDVDLNPANGGSFSVICAPSTSSLKPNLKIINGLLAKEELLQSLSAFKAFQKSVHSHRDQLLRFFETTRNDGDRVMGYGASTKGNVILQFCGLTSQDLPAIGEVNSDKFGSFTPGTKIPIISETAVKEARPDYLMVLPWHFKDFILEKEALYLKNGGRLVFPLPTLKIEQGAS